MNAHTHIHHRLMHTLEKSELEHASIVSTFQISVTNGMQRSLRLADTGRAAGTPVMYHDLNVLHKKLEFLNNFNLKISKNMI